MRPENAAFFATQAARRTADLSQLVDGPESALVRPASGQRAMPGKKLTEFAEQPFKNRA